MKYTIENTVNAGKLVRVFLDGEELSKVVECDTEKGYAIVLKCDEQGRIEVDREAGVVLHERLEGTVTVEPIEDN